MLASVPAIVSGWLLWILLFRYVFGFGWPTEWAAVAARNSSASCGPG